MEVVYRGSTGCSVGTASSQAGGPTIGGFDFQDRDDADVYVKSLMSILKNGNIGIGVTNPMSSFANNTTALQVGTPSTGASLRLEGGGVRGFEIHSGAGGNALEFLPTDNPNLRMALTSIGNVGVGMSIPFERLRVENGNLLIQGTAVSNVFGIRNTDNKEKMFVTVDANDHTGLFLYRDGGGTATIALNTNSNSYFNFGNADIGTTTPQTALDVRDGSSGGRTILTLRTAESVPGTAGRLDFAQSGSITGRITNVFESGGQAGLAFHTYSSPTLAERMRISAMGRVGIGVTNPGYVLDLFAEGRIVNGDGDSKLVIESTVSSLRSQHINFKDVASDWYVGNRFDIDNPNAFGIGRNSLLNDFVISPAGRVGIGTTSPLYRFEVFDNTANTAAAVRQVNPGGQGLFISPAPTRSMLWRSRTPLRTSRATCCLGTGAPSSVWALATSAST